MANGWRLSGWQILVRFPFVLFLAGINTLFFTSQELAFKGEEDCLFLNVYTPGYGVKPDANRPVMVWVHGGGFVFGSGGIEEYGPERFMEEGKVILVTLNYRLGAMGFMSLGNEEITGR